MTRERPEIRSRPTRWGVHGAPADDLKDGAAPAAGSIDPGRGEQRGGSCHRSDVAIPIGLDGSANKGGRTCVTAV